MIPLVLLGWLAGWLLFAGYRRCDLSLTQSEPARHVSVIIPARNEEENLPRLLRSITSAQEIIVVDDCSEDRTPQVVQEHGAHLVVGIPPPTGWCGKTWACQQGAQTANGELLLFLDADTWLEHKGLQIVTREFRGDALSLAPYHSVPTLREQFSAFFNLVMLAGMGPHRLLGQSLLIDRATYQRIGGHGAVRNHLLENFALGQKLAGATGARLGRGVMNMRMYPAGWREMIDGWSKSFATGAARTSRVRFTLVVVWLTGCVLACMHPATYVAFVLQLAFLLNRIGSYRLPTALLYPLPLLFFFFVFARSAFRRLGNGSILWKGRLLCAD